ncbi:MAG: DNA integrity scanning diadenylate cyclase DisA [Actinobacteria bacterium]|nr:DNA integrity scanning diadenylate cyclase DisA [Actinomycetota bacterium]MCL6104867.1 DNA integrity scanning diadenylate cyclase DisA [Actinomycetota bacterium]
MKDALKMIAPGQPLREGLDHILHANKGVLIVIGDQADVLDICSGGFPVNTPFTPQMLYELAKMDGAIILNQEATEIVMANVHLVPSASIPTDETGTRHRTAERVARSIDVPVISASETMSTIALYRNTEKYLIPPTQWITNKANQALQTLERFKNRLDTVNAELNAHEIGDSVTVRDVVEVLQRCEMAMRISDEIEEYLIELGKDGRLVELQEKELLGGVQDEYRLVIKDYLSSNTAGINGISTPQVTMERIDEVMKKLSTLPTEELFDLNKVATILDLPNSHTSIDIPLEPRGYRLLYRIPKLSPAVIDKIVDKFCTLQKVIRASEKELEAIEGVGPQKARLAKDGVLRLVETSILGHYNW